MAKIKNKRLSRNSIDRSNKSSTKNKAVREKRHVLKNFVQKCKEKFLGVPLDLRIFFIGMFFEMLAGITVIAITTTGIMQSCWIIGFLLLTILMSIAFVLIRKHSKRIVVAIVSMFCIMLTLVSFSIDAYLALGIGENIELNSQISDIKKSSELALVTEYSDIYISLEDMQIYSISNFNGMKYINQNKFSPSEESEYFELYSLGIEVYCSIPEIDRLFVYPPTPNTITGYEYLVEIEYKNQAYITKVFIPGVLHLEQYVKEQVFGIAYINTDNFYTVSRLNGYFIFQSDLNSWASPYENVTYTSEKEYFYVRYNRYLRQYWGDDFNEEDEIGEENIKFARSFSVMGPQMQKVNIFWLGHIENEVFIATAPVIEVVYKDGTSDIAVMKDINLSNIDSIISYK